MVLRGPVFSNSLKLSGCFSRQQSKGPTAHFSLRMECHWCWPPVACPLSCLSWSLNLVQKSWHNSIQILKVPRIREFEIALTFFEAKFRPWIWLKTEACETDTAHCIVNWTLQTEQCQESWKVPLCTQQVHIGFNGRVCKWAYPKKWV